LSQIKKCFIPASLTSLISLTLLKNRAIINHIGFNLLSHPCLAFHFHRIITIELWFCLGFGIEICKCYSSNHFHKGMIFIFFPFTFSSPSSSLVIIKPSLNLRLSIASIKPLTSLSLFSDNS